MHKTTFICRMTACALQPRKSDRGQSVIFIWSSPCNVFIVEFHGPGHIFLLTYVGYIMVWCQTLGCVFISFLMDICVSFCNFFLKCPPHFRAHYGELRRSYRDCSFFSESGVWWIKCTDAMTFYHCGHFMKRFWCTPPTAMHSALTCPGTLWDK